MRRIFCLSLSVLLFLVLFSGCSKSSGDFLNFTKPKAGDQVATIETTMGNIKVMFFKQVAPKAVENFITHAKNGYYNNVSFHRVLSDFMIQGGDPTGTGSGGESIWGKPFVDEISDKALNFRGALSMANSGPNTNGSQFFIVQAGNGNITDSSFAQLESQTGKKISQAVIDKYKKVGGAPWLDGSYTVFGQVLEGMDVVDKIASVKVDANSKPLTPVLIKKIVVATQK
jgi:peptidyl-prolyl cis-trans isomerase B (cyclophilin B)